MRVTLRVFIDKEVRDLSLITQLRTSGFAPNVFQSGEGSNELQFFRLRESHPCPFHSPFGYSECLTHLRRGYTILRIMNATPAESSR